MLTTAVVNSGGAVFDAPIPNSRAHKVCVLSVQ